MITIDSLPYLLQLIKKSIVLHALITSGSVMGVDLKNYDYNLIGNGIHFNNFSLSQNDTFDEVMFFVAKDVLGKKTDSVINIILTTNEAKYFDKSDFYFNDDETRGKNKHPAIREERKFRKDLGVFQIFEKPIPPAIVSIKRNSEYQYRIFIRFYSNFKEVLKRKKEMDDSIEKDIGW